MAAVLGVIIDRVSAFLGSEYFLYPYFYCVDAVALNQLSVTEGKIACGKKNKYDFVPLDVSLLLSSIISVEFGNIR